MKTIKNIFLTGITGYIGGTIAVKLRENNYNVTGLVRKQEDAERLNTLGFETVLGDLQNEEILKKSLENTDAVVHTADSDSADVPALFLKLLKDSNKTFIYTSGSSIVANWEYPNTASFVYNEDFPLPTNTSQGHRVVINRDILHAAIDNIRTIVIVPSMVYGEGLLLNKESKQLPLLIQTAKEQGHAVYVGDGKHSWSNVHVEDLAELYLAALVNAQAGSIFFAENGIASFKEIADVTQSSLLLNGSAKSLSKADATGLWGDMMASVALGSDCRMTAEKARKMLDWKPQYNSVLDWIKQL